MNNQEKPINPAVVVIARESRGLTQSELARRLSVSQGWLSRVESGLRGVPNSILEKLSAILDYPVTFFMQERISVYGPGVGELFHRRRKVVSNRTLNKIYAQINIRRMHVAKMLEGVDIGDVSIRPFEIEEFDGSVKEIARAIRTSWHLPHGPIRNLTEAIEHARGIVIPFDFGTRRIDAISHWPPGVPPLFFVNINSPADRLRFTLCHELGHIIMHQHYPTPDMEQQADEFAAEFLMPGKEIRPYLADLSLPKLADLKPYWRVSMAALLKRAADLGEITQWQARSLWMQMGKAGYKTREPIELNIPSETPSLWQEIVSAYSNDMGYSISELAKMLNLFEREAMHIYFGAPRYLKDEEFKEAVKEAENIIRRYNKGKGDE